MKKFFNKIFLIGFVSLGFLSCGGVDVVTDKKEFSEEDLQKASYAIAEISPCMADVILDSNDLINQFYQKALELADGDYDVLFEDAKNFSVDLDSSRSVKGKTFYNALRSEYNSCARSVTSKNLDELLSDIPYLNFYFYAPDYTKEYSKEDVLVTYLDYTVDEFDQEILTAYDYKGNVVEIDGIEVPDFPVIVIGINEREAISAQRADVDVCRSAKIYNGYEEHTEILNTIEWLAAYGTYDPWPRGYPEVYCLYVYYPNGTRGDYKKVDKKGVYKFDTNIFSFSNSYMNKHWQLAMYDEDFGGKSTLVNFLLGEGEDLKSVTMTVKSNDDYIGSTTIPFYHEQNHTVQLGDGAKVTLSYKEEK